MARPVELDQDKLAKAVEYLDSVKNMGVHTLLPTVEGLAIACDISRDTIYEWEKVPEAPEDATDKQLDYIELRAKFSDIVRRLRIYQGEKTLQNALIGRYSPKIAGMVLAKHGYVEKAEVDQKTEHSGGITVQVTKFDSADTTPQPDA